MGSLDSKTIMHTLQTSEQAWQQGNRLILWRYERWHYVTLAHDLSQIVAVSFASEEKARIMFENMTHQANLVAFTEVAPNFTDELAGKVLPEAEAYRDPLANGRCHLIAGYTTDTLHTVEADIDTLVHTIQQRMAGKPGAYISFR